MKINYRVLSVDEAEHTVVVRYWTDILSEESLATHFTPSGDVKMTANGYPERCRTDYNLNLQDIPNPSSNDILTIIKSSAPINWLYMMEEISSSNSEYSLSNIMNLINVSDSFQANLVIRTI